MTVDKGTIENHINTQPIETDLVVRYKSDGTQTIYAFPFKVYFQDPATLQYGLEVIRADPNADPILLRFGADYTVQPNPPTGAPPEVADGGTITLLVAATVDSIITIFRRDDYSQPVDFGGLTPEELPQPTEDSFDLNARRDQELFAIATANLIVPEEPQEPVFLGNTQFIGSNVIGKVMEAAGTAPSGLEQIQITNVTFNFDIATIPSGSKNVVAQDDGSGGIILVNETLEEPGNTEFVGTNVVDKVVKGLGTNVTTGLEEITSTTVGFNFDGTTIPTGATNVIVEDDGSGGFTLVNAPAQSLITGSPQILAKFNDVGDNVVDSNVAQDDEGTVRIIGTPTIPGSLSLDNEITYRADSQGENSIVTEFISLQDFTDIPGQPPGLAPPEYLKYCAVRREVDGTYSKTLVEPPDSGSGLVQNPVQDALVISDGTDTGLLATAISKLEAGTGSSNQGLQVVGDLNLVSDVSELYDPKIRLTRSTESYALDVETTQGVSYDIQFGLVDSETLDLVSIERDDAGLIKLVPVKLAQSGNTFVLDDTAPDNSLPFYQEYTQPTTGDILLDYSATTIRLAVFKNLKLGDRIDTGIVSAPTIDNPIQANVEIDLSLGAAFIFGVQENINLSFIVPTLAAGEILKFVLNVVQTASGFFKITYPANVTFPDGISYQPVLLAGKYDILQCCLYEDGSILIETVFLDATYTTGSIFNITPGVTAANSVPTFEAPNSLQASTTLMANSTVSQLSIRNSDMGIVEYNIDAIPSAAAYVIDPSASALFSITLDQNITISLDVTNLTNLTLNQILTTSVVLTHDGSANTYTIGWDSSVVWAFGDIPDTLGSGSLTIYLRYIGMHFAIGTNIDFVAGRLYEEVGT